MNVPHGGSDRVLEIRTEKVDIVIRGLGERKSAPGSPRTTALTVHARALERIAVRGETLAEGDAAALSRCRLWVEPLLLSDRRYEVLIRSRLGEAVAFSVERGPLRSGVGPLLDGVQELLAGSLDCCGFGEAALSVRAAGETCVEICTEVAPEMLQYKEDHRRMLAAIAREGDRAAAAWLRKNCAPSDMTEQAEADADLPELLAALTPDRVSSGLRGIISPSGTASREKYRFTAMHAPGGERLWPAGGRRAADALALYLLRGGMNAWEQYRDRRLWLECASAEENVAAAASQISMLYEAAEASLAGDPAAPPQGPVYGADAWLRYASALQKTLRREGDVWTMPAEETVRLYPRWCFCCLASMLRRYYLPVGQEAAYVSRRGTVMLPVNDVHTELRFFDPQTQMDVTLTCDPPSEEGPAACRAPGGLITVTGDAEGDGAYQLALAPRYRVSGGSADDGPAAEPREEDLRSIRRYRDDMVRRGGRTTSPEKPVYSAFVLFPADTGSDTPAAAGNLHTGALPFSPERQEDLERLLERCIEDSRRAPFPPTPLPALWESELAQVDWSAPDVLVGSLRSRQQYEINLRQKFYYTPLENIPPEWAERIRYIALCRQKSWGCAGIRFYGGVSRMRKVKRREIPVESAGRSGDEDYWLFEVSRWQPMFLPIEIQEESVYRPRFTHAFLLKHCRASYELFDIRSALAFRLLYALRRCLDAVAANDEESRLPIMLVDRERRLWLHRGEIQLCTTGGEMLFAMPAEEFSKDRRRGLQKLLEALRQQRDRDRPGSPEQT